MNNAQTYNSSGTEKASHANDSWLGHLRAAVVSTILLTILLGGIYPLTVWAIARLPGLRDKADGSLIVRDGKVIGSTLIGQSFTGKSYFHPRPSGAGSGYDASLSSGTNWGPTNAKLVTGVADDPATPDADESVAGVPQLAVAYRETNGLSATDKIPADAVTRSASGLDPHISLENARLQTSRVAKERGMTQDAVRSLVDKNTNNRDLGLLGDPAVNVLTLNLALDAVAKQLP